MDRSWTRVPALLGAILAGACAEDDGLSDEDAWARRHAEAICAAEHDSGCECDTRFSSRATCDENRHDEIRGLQRMAIGDGDSFDLDCANAHIAVIEDLDCGGLSAFLDSGDFTTCAIYTGAKEVGEVCSGYSWGGLYSSDQVLGQWMSDCAPGLMCVSGRCVTPDMPYFPLELDAPCFDPGTLQQLGVCTGEQLCNYETGRCVAPAQVGESCAGGTPCSFEGFCDAGQCAPRKADGEPCAASYECMANCADGVCVPFSTEDPPAACFGHSF